MEHTFFKKGIALVCGGTLTLSLMTGIFFLSPEKAEAQYVPVGDLVNFEFHASEWLKEENLDALAWALAKEVLNQLTADIVDWAGSGFEGEPAFVQSPLRFAGQVTDETTDYVLDEIEDFVEDAPFGGPIIKNLLREHTQTFFDEGYNLDRHSSDPERFLAGDFSKGGWDAWAAVVSDKDNNFLGSYLKAKNRKENLVETVKAQEFLKLEWGDGWKSVEDDYGNVLTPGGVIEDQVQEALSSTFDGLENADELSEVLASTVGVLVNQVFSDTGLVGASQTQPGSNDTLTDLLRRAATLGTQEVGPLPTPNNPNTSPGSDN